MPGDARPRKKSKRLRRELNLNNLSSRTSVLLRCLAQAWNAAGKIDGDVLMEQHIHEFNVKELLRVHGQFGYYFSVPNKGRDWSVVLKSSLLDNKLEVVYTTQDEQGYLYPVTCAIRESVEEILRLHFLGMFGIHPEEIETLFSQAPTIKNI